MKRAAAALLTIMLALVTPLSAQIRELKNGDILIADFEGETYGDWKVEGKAFGTGPARGALEGQMDVFGFKGKGLVNSFLGGDEPTGKLISPEFTLDKDFVNFLIGGGGDMKKTVMRLMVLWDDEWHLFRIATGPNKEPGGSEELVWESWDVSEEIGVTARIEIIDDASGVWGHINVDHIVLSDSSFVTILPDHMREITITDNYLHFPVDTEARQRLVKVQKDIKSVREFQIRLAEGEPDFWVYLETHDFRGETLTLTMEQKRSDPGNLLDRIKSGNKPKNFDTFYTEKLRPQFHFSNPRGWNNDPNGMVYYEGEYHLFYQRNPFGWPWGNMTWGHAVSTDMLHWKNLPDALHPDDMGTMFSGTGKVDTFNRSGFKTGDEDPILLFYTAAGGTNPWSKGVPFTQCVAYSNDRGRTFTKCEGNPIIGHIRGGNRDPKVLWHEPSKKWVLVLYIEEEEMAFFNSDDLKHWTETSRIKGFHECPELFELPVDGDKSNMKWVLYGAPGNYQIGSFDGKTFTPEGPNRRYNFGNAFYASQTFNDIPEEDGRRIQMGWGTIATPGMPFNQMMNFPVELSLRTTPSGIRLCPVPIREIRKLYKKKRKYTDTTLKSGTNFLDGFNAELLDIDLHIKPQDARKIGFRIRDMEIVYENKAKLLISGEERASVRTIDGMVKLRLLVDRTSIEVFANEGEVFMPLGAVPGKNAGKLLELFAEGGNAEIVKLSVRELKSVWEASK